MAYSNETLTILEAIRRHAITLYKVQTPTNLQEAAQSFQNDPSQRMPNFEYGNLDIGKINESIYHLGILKAAVDNDQSGLQALLQLYWNETMLMNRIAQAAYYALGRYGQIGQHEVDVYRRLQTELYGSPDQATFEALYGTQLYEVQKRKVFFNREDKHMYDQLIQRFPLSAVEEAPVIAKKKLVDQFERCIKVHLGSVLANVPDNQPSFAASDAIGIINRTIASLYQDRTQFHAELAPAGTPVSVDQIERKILVPDGRVFSRSELISLVLGHEFGVHVMRGIPFESCEIVELSRGLPQYNDFEEGLATAVEQTLSGKVTLRGVNHYVNVSLATFYGADFRTVYETRLALLYLSRLDGTQTTAKDRLKLRTECEKQAFTQTMRCFRGTGYLVNFKDLTYYNGNAKVWRFIQENMSKPDLMSKLFRSGKTDPTNDLHMQVLSEALRSFSPNF